MTRRTPSLLALGALVAACSSGGKTSDAPAHLCTPDAFVLCLCADGSHGTKQCAQGGDSFSVCADCSADAPGAGGGAGFGEGGRTGSKGGGGSGGGSGSTGGGGSGSGGGGSGGGTGSTGGSGASSGSGGASSGGASSGGASSGSGGASSGSGGASSGGASSGNGGTGGNAGPVAGDACPGIAISLTPETDPLVPGTTVGASDDYPSPCAKKAGADVVYAVTASVAGTITVKAQAQAPLWPVLGAWTGACAQGPLAACTDGSAVAGTASLSVSVAAGATAYVVVDSDGAAGPFALSLHLAPGSVCGDGKTESPEQCDDGNTKAGDGCAPDCTVEANPPLADCPGLAWHVWGPTSSVSGATTTYMNFDQGSCGGAKAKDRFYKIVPEASGTLHAKITTASFDAVIYARTGDCIGGAEVACNDAIGLGGDHIDVPVSAGAPLWVAIDGYSTMSGTFTLTVSVD